ncbi:hypothetical protein CLV92_101506 [Kineococcus xinjiangensis]|uniref:Mannosyltransferase PIG-V n=1 Tax=Kineococcus xinjiangensis TaxID=512762 RepID=A0A2S6IWZ6_9ACTN|nr:hypothetical protein [Kineococcus xinjiangensis]PPK98805.1 hypothetical protein CLV92_101506 [Kineococcus xinjiangensis]
MVRAWPWWVRVLLLYTASRLFSAAVLDRVARFQEPNPWTGPDPGLGGVLLMWDAAWYREIAERGYPDVVSRTPDGRPLQSALAFYPLFPLLVRVVTAATGVPFAVAGPLVAVLLGAGAALVAHRAVHAALSAAGAGEAAAGRGAWAAVVLLCTYPASPVLLAPYSEGLALLLLGAFLLQLVHRRYLAAAALALLLGLARPVAAPLLAVVLAHVAVRAVRWWRAGRPWGRPQAAVAARAAVLLLASGAAGLLWPAGTWWLTGRHDAHLATMAAWRGGGEVVLVQPWWDVSQYLLGEVAGPVALLLVLGGHAALLLSRRAAPLGPELRAWCLAYVAYLVLVQDPFTNLVRYLLLLFPLGALLEVGPGRAAAASGAPGGSAGGGGQGVGVLAAVACASLFLQVLWVASLWHFTPPADWSP